VGEYELFGSENEDLLHADLEADDTRLSDLRRARTFRRCGVWMPNALIAAGLLAVVAGMFFDEGSGQPQPPNKARL
jgi:hypothetical protein